MDKRLARSIAKIAFELMLYSRGQHFRVEIDSAAIEPVIWLRSVKDVKELELRVVVNRTETEDIYRVSSWINSVEFCCNALEAEINQAGLRIPEPGNANWSTDDEGRS